MKSQLINDNGEKTYALVLDDGDEAIASITKFAKEKNLNASQFTAVGAFSRVVTGFFDFSIKDYRKNKIDEQVEVLALTGDIATHEGTPKVHAHVVVGKSDGTAHGGHLLEGYAHPTLEIILTESPAHLRRKMDENIGIALIEL
ncbi:PPC domain-containing DNA-binding protein [Salmonirosea aquatica]|uniref:DUF296 domain-containing protein n=1 Tax=Salmonirosea aquatica TaxID=2654236 RepID=A0A7C9BMC6_9BACT|nr:DUF296 domain-containing protein [Cytophagaceae bacterium SJW1-29]